MISVILAISTLLSAWQFRQEPSEQMPLVDTTWHEVSIPHDWAISGDFDRANDLQEVIVVQNGESEPSWQRRSAMDGQRALPHARQSQ